MTILLAIKVFVAHFLPKMIVKASRRLKEGMNAVLQAYIRKRKKRDDKIKKGTDFASSVAFFLKVA